MIGAGSGYNYQRGLKSSMLSFCWNQGQYCVALDLV